MKFLSGLCTFLALVLYFMVVWVDTLRNEVAALEEENKLMANELKRHIQNDTEKNERKKQASKFAENDKINFDWHRDIYNSDVIGELRRTCKACSKRN